MLALLKAAPLKVCIVSVETEWNNSAGNIAKGRAEISNHSTGFFLQFYSSEELLLWQLRRYPVLMERKTFGASRVHLMI